MQSWSQPRSPWNCSGWTTTKNLPSSCGKRSKAFPLWNRIGSLLRGRPGALHEAEAILSEGPGRPHESEGDRLLEFLNEP